MIFCLSKVSSPGWDKRFWTIKGLKKELELNICLLCFQDRDFSENYDKMTNLEKIAELLATPCGAEFMVDIFTENLIKREL